METQELVQIDLIDHNPYQPRHVEDAAAVAEIAESIKHNGLMQVPSARRVGDRVQLAFGHTRLAAFKLNGEPCMPLIIRELTDLQMFELGVAENIKRRDLNPIEQAESMRRYMDEFKKTSVETGEFFNVSAETVRGKVRLLNLPEPARAKLAEGSITIDTARDLLTAQKIGGEEAIFNALGEMGRDDSPRDVVEIIEEAIQGSSTAQKMAYGLAWRDVVKFPVKYLAPLSRKALADLLDVTAQDVERKKLLSDVMQLLESGMEITDFQFPSFLPEQLDKVRILANPPACTSCPLHATFDGTHYCGLKLCYERKDHAWAQAETAKLVKDIGISLYVNEATDGKAAELSRWTPAHQKLYKDRHADLRLRPTTRSVWNNFDGLPDHVVVVAVGKTAEKLLKANGKAVEKAQNETRDYQLESRIKVLKDEHVNRFLWTVAVPAFESLLETMNNLPFMLFLYTDVMYDAVDYLPGMDGKEEQIDQIQQAKKKAEALKQLRRLMIAEVLDRAIEWDSYTQFDHTEKPVIEFSKRAQKYAKEWDCKLPKNWPTQAEQYQSELEAALKELES